MREITDAAAGASLGVVTAMLSGEWGLAADLIASDPEGVAAALAIHVASLVETEADAHGEHPLRAWRRFTLGSASCDLWIDEMRSRNLPGWES